MSAWDAVVLVVGILAFVGLAFVAVWIPIGVYARRTRGRLEAELGHSVVRLDNARGLGLLSRGPAQVRGNGWLALTDEELRFDQWVPNRRTTIPLTAVTGVGTERWWLGKTVGSKLLCVRWRTADGGEDAMAWEVPELDAWLAALDGLSPAPLRVAPPHG